VKAVLHYAASPGFRERLERESEEGLEIVVVDVRERDRFASEMRGARVLLHVLEPVTAEMIAGAPALRLIQKIGVGVNTIDVAAARARGVAVANMPGTNTQAVAEATLALMFAALRRVPELDARVRAGTAWQQDDRLFDRVGEIGGKTVGLLGFGAVARRLVPVLDALGARVRYTATGPKADAEPAEWRLLPELLREADVLSLHLPLTLGTEKLLDADAFARMKHGSVLVNAARGGLVDEQALIVALRSGQLGAAGLDVFAQEPPASDSPLLTLPNVVLTPHVAWLTPETLERSLRVALENCRRLRKGEPLLHRVA
jgi:phosphoglycerate dehydrogenase-like enzyme